MWWVPGNLHAVARGCYDTKVVRSSWRLRCFHCKVLRCTREYKGVTITIIRQVTLWKRMGTNESRNIQNENCLCQHNNVIFT